MINIKSNIQNITDTTAIEAPIFTTGDEFWTKGKTSLRRFIISDNGNADNILNISFYDVPSDTFVKDFNFVQENNVQKLLYKILSINSSEEAIVEIYLENGETQKKLNKYYSSILRNKNLFYEGAEFYIVYEKLIDGMNIHIESYKDYCQENILFDSIYKKMVN